MQELIALVENGTLDARIDLEKGLLVSKQTNLRADVHREAIESIEEYINEAHIRLIRTNVLGAGLQVMTSSTEGKTDIGSRPGRAPSWN